MKEAKQMEELLESAADKGMFNGVMLIARGRQILYQGAHGWADCDSGRMLNPDTVFELASLSKPFTAAGIMLLEQQGRLGYDDPIEDWLEDIPYSGMTIRHLLHHTSGLPDYMLLFLEHWDRSRIAVNDDVLSMLKRYRPPVLFAPNERWMYSNTGYVLLAILIERISGLSFAEFMKQELFHPLGMHRTCVFNRRLAGRKLTNDAIGYSYDWKRHDYRLPEELEDQDFVVYLDGIQGDGTVQSTIEDLYRFDRAIEAGELITKTAWMEAFTPGRLNNGEAFDYGFGWIISEDDSKGKSVSHSGGWPGYYTMMTRYLDNDQTLIYLSNTDRDIESQQAVIQAAESILFGQPVPIPEPKAQPEAIPLDPAVYAGYEGDYVLEDGQHLKVKIVQDCLVLLLPGQPSYELYPLSSTLFFIIVPEVRVEFAADEYGRAEELIIHQLGQHRAVRV
ncbi:serine hydrolase domain-containing protein [Paenibacillus thailandensis]|uniref:Serine hydrolase domain-containing protein n=1 Tax=Paenibacillus thailandensis TaxID=393250 RepID=A0ABW5R5U9_9BACL